MEGVCRAWRLGSLASYAATRTLTTEDWRWPAGWDHRIVSTEAFYWAVKRLGPYVTGLRLDDRQIARGLRPQVVAIAVRSCPLLTRVDLTGARVRPAALRDLASAALALTELRVGQSFGSVESELSALLAPASRLAVFVASTTEFAGVALMRISPGLRELRLKSCEGVLSAPVGAALAALTCLSAVELTQCRSLTSEEPLRALVENESLHVTLRELIITDVDFSPLPDEEQEGEIEAPRMLDPQFIELQIGPAETARTVAEVFTELRTLTTMFCGWVANAFVINIGSHLVRLTELDLSGCSNIRGQFALEPLSTLPELIRLTINNLHPSVGGQVLGIIASLEEIRARDSQGINDEDVSGAATGCLRLRILDVEGCLAVTDRTLHGATEIVRRQGRTALLRLSVGGTSAGCWTTVRPSLVLHIIRDRVYAPILHWLITSRRVA
ncbi:uncharacterized protein LOC114881887 [Osmia bicornis bicornis]|uniref:uncharacterized protein LOC114881887 n=1 Tax=Osmia bicornis bicornis TaxID=1437191 RepID=UPI001EAEF7BD|nr:uncharacterized protein LOC114881887 [Osmia bicornis bicornis]